jgi:hypothetical protein
MAPSDCTETSECGETASVHTVEIRDEQGEVLDRAHDSGQLAALAAEVADDPWFACLRFVDPYGDTVFNARQATQFAIELTRRADPEDETVQRVVEMADRVGGEVHQYLWLLGD